jgi:hypothetical protein
MLDIDSGCNIALLVDELLERLPGFRQRDKEFQRVYNQYRLLGTPVGPIPDALGIESRA